MTGIALEQSTNNVQKESSWTFLDQEHRKQIDLLSTRAASKTSTMREMESWHSCMAIHSPRLMSDEASNLFPEWGGAYSARQWRHSASRKRLAFPRITSGSRMTIRYWRGASKLRKTGPCAPMRLMRWFALSSSVAS